MIQLILGDIYMSRSFSLVGLPRQFKELSQTLNLKVVDCLPFKEYFHSDGYECKVYLGNNGIRYEEFEAGCPWNGGPELYLGLRNSDTKEVVCTWTESQMGFSEDIDLPKIYEPEISKVKTLFVKEENSEWVKGYCALYVHLKKDSIDLFQSRTSKFPDVEVLTIMIQKESDGDTIRDFLVQEGYSIEEISMSANDYVQSRIKYLESQK